MPYFAEFDGDFEENHAIEQGGGAAVILGFEEDVNGNEIPVVQDRAPFFHNLGHAPETMVAEDGGNQDELLLNIQREQLALGDETSYVKYRKRHTSPITLRQLKKVFTEGKATQAMQHLTKKLTITSLNDVEFCIPTDDKDLSWLASDHFLDYLMIVPSAAGFHAVIPVNEVALDYELTMVLNRMHWEFPEDTKSFYANPNERMLCAFDYAQATGWIFACPNAHAGADAPLNVGEGWTKKRTRMTPVVARVIMSFLAHCMDHKGIRDMTKTVNYPNVESHYEFKTETNLM